jgi:hypothetical protein
MSSITIPPESITSAVASDALGRHLTYIRQIFFTPAASCTQQTFLLVHESVVTLLADMRLTMYTASGSFHAQREESIRFVTAIGVVCRVLALKLPWPSQADDILLVPIRNWENKILRSWEGWLIQFIRIVTYWFDETVSPNNVLRELSLARLTAPEVPLVAVGGDSILFERFVNMLDSFVEFVRAPVHTIEIKRYWGIEVLRACILLLGDGINFAFVEGAFSPAVDEEQEEEEEEEAGQALLDAFEAAQPLEVYHDDDQGSEDEDEYEDEEDDDDMDDDDDDDDDDDTYMLSIGGEEDEDDGSIPFLFFPARRSGLNYPEKHAAENVPIVSHRKAYSGHCNVKTVLFVPPTI